MIIIAGHVFLDPSDVHEFLADARATIPDALTEEGCEFISFTLDDPNAASVTVLERWRSQEDIDAHIAKPTVTAIFTKWGAKMRSATRKYDAVNERAPI